MGSFEKSQAEPTASGLNGLGKLSAREREVVALVAEGLSNEEIAERLVVTPGTVANHIAHILKDLSLKNRVQVAMWAVEHGLRAPQAQGRDDKLPRARCPMCGGASSFAGTDERGAFSPSEAPGGCAERFARE